VQSDIGFLGYVSGYFGVIEAQGQGSLHVHMLLWLADTPSTDAMHRLLNTDHFRAQVQKFVKMNIRADVDGLDENTVNNMAWETQLAYSHPPSPDDENWEKAFADRLCCVM